MNKTYIETIKVLDGVFYYLEYHQKRVNDSLEVNAHYILKELLDSPPTKGLYRCRIVYSLNFFKVEYIQYVKRNVKTLKVLYNDILKYDKKYENRALINKLFLDREKCDDILIVQNGLIKDTSIANIALFDGNTWVAPKNPLLYGTTMRRLVNESKITLKDIKIEDIKLYQKIALMNAMIDFDIILVENIEDIIC